MENPIQTFIPNPMLASVHLLISMLMGILSFFADHADQFIKYGTGAVGIISGAMAFLYYREAWLCKREERKSLQSKSDTK
jgi:hypothetical protein